MVAVTLVPLDDATGLALLRLQTAPAGASTITQPSATGPVKPLSPFTTKVSVMLLPTLVAILNVFAVTEKFLTESVMLAERVTPIPELVPTIAMVEFAAVAPATVPTVTTEL